MFIDHKDYDDVTAVYAKGFWYNLAWISRAYVVGGVC